MDNFENLSAILSLENKQIVVEKYISEFSLREHNASIVLFLLQKIIRPLQKNMNDNVIRQH